MIYRLHNSTSNDTKQFQFQLPGELDSYVKYVRILHNIKYEQTGWRRIGNELSKYIKIIWLDTRIER